MDLVVNHTAKDRSVARQHPEWFLHEPDGSLASPYAVDPTDTSKRTVWADLAEIDYARPASASGDRRLLRRRRPPLRQDRLPRLPLRCRLQGAEGSLARADQRRAARRATTFCSPPKTWARCWKRRWPCAGRLRLPVQQLEVVGLPAELAARSVRTIPLDRPVDFLPGVARHQSTDQRPSGAGITDPKEVERRYSDAYLFAAVFSTGVMIPIGYEYGFREEAARCEDATNGLGDADLRSDAVHRRGEPDEGVAAGAQRGRAAAGHTARQWSRGLPAAPGDARTGVDGGVDQQRPDLAGPRGSNRRAR